MRDWKPKFFLILPITAGLALFVLTFIDQEKRPGQGEVGPLLSMLLPYLVTRCLGLDHEPIGSFVNSTTFDALINGLFGLLLVGVFSIAWRLIKNKTAGGKVIAS